MLVRYFPQFIISDRFIIKRSLPAPGKIFCQPEEKVAAFNILGETKQSRKKQALLLAEELRIKPHKIKKFLAKNVKTGALLQRDELVAKKSFLFPPKTKKIFSPFDAVVEKIDEAEGKILLCSEPEKIKLFSGISGSVEKVENQRDVFIKIFGLKIQGVLAGGEEVFGEIKILKQGEVFRENTLGTKFLVFLDNTSLLDLEKIKALAPQAMIFCHLSKNVFDKSQIKDSFLNFMIINGFSNKAYNKGCKKLFEFLEGKQAFFNSSEKSLTVVFRKKTEKIFPLKIRENLLNSEQKRKTAFCLPKPGQTVKILAGDFFAAEGKIEKIGGGFAEVALLFEEESVSVPLESLLILK